MATLEFKTAGFEQRAIELHPGVNRFGRAPGNDVQVDHPTVSSVHCEVELGFGRTSIRDCGSTNGTFLDGAAVNHAELRPGQTLRLGNVEFMVTDLEIPISIPKFESPVNQTALQDSRVGPSCHRHVDRQPAHRCTHCGWLHCDECVHRLRRRGGKTLCLCPSCSYPTQAIAGKAPKKPSLLHRLRQTTRMLINRAIRRNQPGLN